VEGEVEEGGRGRETNEIRREVKEQGTGGS
jgi:hypothetical protein